jgi:hypothetical protein
VRLGVVFATRYHEVREVFLNGPFAHVAELGCGDKILVHVLLDGDPGLTVDAYDISTASLARAAERIKTHCGTTERCRFLPIDLNKEILPEAA